MEVNILNFRSVKQYKLNIMQFYLKTLWDFTSFVGFWNGQLTSLHVILDEKDEFFEPTIHKDHPPTFSITSHAIMSR